LIQNKVQNNPRLLHVEELSGKEIHSEISEISKTWRDLSKQYYTNTTDPNLRSLYERSFIVNRIIRNRCKKESHFLRHYSVAICYDLDLTIQGFALLKTIKPSKNDVKQPNPDKNFLFIAYLSKKPEELSPTSNVKKVGEKIIHSLTLKSKEQFIGLCADPIPQAQSLFRSLGFVSDPERLSKHSSNREMLFLLLE
jgi:hypothetical protein